MAPDPPPLAGTIEADERVANVRFEMNRLVVDLIDGRTISVPVAWYPRLAKASDAQRMKWERIGSGEGIHWRDVDEDLSVSGLLRGIPAPQLRPKKNLPQGARPSLVRGRSQQNGSRPMALETTPFDAAEYLDGPGAILAYLEAAFEDGDPELIALALNDAARARGLAENALTAHSDIAAVIRTLKSLGLELTARAA